MTYDGSAGPLQITFFTRRNCPLCDVALAALHQILSGVEFDLQKVDIDEHTQHKAAYDHHVPVIWVNGREVCRHRLDREKLLAAIASVRSQRGSSRSLP